MSQASQLSFISNPTGQIVIPATTASVSTNTGALQVAGGVGIGGDLYAGTIYSNGSPVATSAGGGLTSVQVYLQNMFYQ